MNILQSDDPVAVRLTQAIRLGEPDSLKRIMADAPALATSTIRAENEEQRSLLHIATDWPGNFPNIAETIALLVGAGADVNARFIGSHTETPLHWAASSNDVKAVDALLDAGADIEARGAVTGGGTPLSDAINFAQWDAARRLVERGAQTRLGDEAALGLFNRVTRRFEKTTPGQEAIDYAFWMACSTGQKEIVEFLLDHGANMNWLPEWENTTPLDAATNGGYAGLVTWLRDRGAQSAPKSPRMTN